MKLNTDKILITVIALLILSVGLIIMASVYQSKRVIDTAKMVLHKQETLIESEKILTHVVDNETGSRGFVLTGDKTYLEPLQKAQEQIYNELARLKVLTSDNPLHQVLADSISFYVNQKINFSNKTVSVRELNGAIDATAMVNTGEGKFYTDRIRLLIDKIQTADIDLLAKKRLENETKAEGLYRILVSVIAVILLLAAFFFQKIRSDLAEKKNAALVLAKQNDELERRVLQRTNDLLFSKNVLSETFNRITDGFVALDNNWCYTYVNKKAGEILGSDPGKLVGKNIWTEFPEAANLPFYMAFNKAVSSQQYLYLKEYYPPLGIWLENHIYPSPDGLSVFFRDITQQKVAEQKIKKNNRLYLFQSQISKMIVRIKDEKTLYKEACRIAIDLGEFRMAWIGIIDEHKKEVIPVMHAGEEEGYLSKIKTISVADVPEGRGPTGTAIREGKFIICNDIESDPQMNPWKEEAGSRGYLSSMALPIKKFGQVTGAFSFYAGEKNFFDETEIALLEQATSDISFALENFEKEFIRKKAEEAVFKSEQRYQALANIAPVGIFHTDANGATTYVNPRWCSISGLSAEDAMGNGWLKAVYEEDKEATLKGWKEAVKSQKLSFSSYRFAQPDGNIVWVLGQAIPETNAENEVVGYVGTITDITELKNAAQQKEEERRNNDALINSTNDLMWSVTKDYKLITGNRFFIEAMKDVTGFLIKPGDNLLMKDYFQDDYLQYWKDCYDKALEGETLVKEIMNAPTKSLDISWFEINLHPIYIGNEINGVACFGRNITERKKAAEQIIKEKELSETILNNLPGICYLYDESGKFLLWNKYFENISGYNSKEIRQMKPFYFYDVSQKEIIEERMKNVFLHPTTGIELEILTKNKTKIPFYINSLMIVYEGKNCILGMGIDLTDRKKAAEALQTAESRLQFLLSSTPAVIYSSQAEFPFAATFISENITVQTGYLPEDFLNDPNFWSNNIHPGEKEKVMKGLIHLFENRQHTHEYRFRIKDGSFVWMYDELKLILDDAGKPLEIVGYRITIDDRKKAEQAIQESEEKYRTLVEQASDAIFIADAEGRFISVNASSCKLTQYSERELLQKTIYDFALLEDIKQNPFQFDKLKKGEPASAERRMMGKNGIPLYVEINAKLLADGRLLAFVRDISERKKAADEMKAVLDRLLFHIENSPLGFIEWDQHLFVKSWSKRSEEIFGWTEEEFKEKQKTGFSLVYEEHLPDVGEIVNQLTTSQLERNSIINKNYTKDGRIITCEWFNSVLKDKEGKVVTIMSLVQDITARTQVERALEERENYLRTIVQAEPECVKLLGINNELEDMNPAGLAMIEADSLEQVIGKSVLDIVNSDYRNAFEGLTRDIFTGKSGSLEFEITGLKGTRRWLETQAVPVKNEQGKTTSLLAVTRDITERIKAQEKLIESEEKYRQIVETAQEGIWTIDEHNNTTFANNKMAEMLGYTKEEMLGRQLYDFMDDRGRAISDANINRRKNGIKEQHDFALQTKDGKTIWTLMETSPIMKEGKYAGALAMVIDITDRKKAEEEIKKSNERFDLIARATNEVLWDWNLLTGEVWWNESFYNMFGFDDPAPTHATGWSNTFHPEDKQRVVDGVYKIITSGEKYWYDEYRSIKKDGSIVYIYDRGFVLHDETGKAYRMIGSMQDFTERKNAQDEIIKEKKLSDSIVNSLPGIFYLFNKEGKFLRWNSNFEKVTFYNEAEIRDMHAIDFFDKDEKELVSKTIDAVFTTGGQELQADLLLKTKERIPYYFTGISIEYEGSPCVMGVGIDFSERVKSQEGIKQTSEKLRQLTAHLQKIREEERSRIGREIHDELGQQLTAIKMDVVWVDKNLPPETMVIKNKLKNVTRLLDGSNKAIRRILSELRPTVLDDHGLVEALEWLNLKFTKSTGIRVEMMTEETSFKLPEEITTCIFRVYQEALTNITKYAKAGKVLTSLHIIEDKLLFSVKDNGRGFDAEAIQSKKSFGILGMRERVLLLEGQFELVSSRGNGTSISISIPLKL